MQPLWFVTKLVTRTMILLRTLEAQIPLQLPPASEANSNEMTTVRPKGTRILASLSSKSPTSLTIWPNKLNTHVISFYLLIRPRLYVNTNDCRGLLIFAGTHSSPFSICWLLHLYIYFPPPSSSVIILRNSICLHSKAAECIMLLLLYFLPIFNILYTFI